MIERVKKQEYERMWSNNDFWRTCDQSELDWFEERDEDLFGYDFKWDKLSKAPNLWEETYPEAKFASINRENYLPFIT